jgi:hypothetical protein
MQRLADNLQDLCPFDWTRHITESHEWTSEALENTPKKFKHSRCYYKHTSNSETEFWHPVPTPSSGNVNNPMVLAPFISCKTRRCFSYAYNLSTGEESVIRDKNNVWIGCYWSHGIANDSKFDFGPQARLELVEVGMGNVSEEAWARSTSPYKSECLDEERPKLGDKYEFYPVLSIERKEGVSYRTRIGRVEKNL